MPADRRKPVECAQHTKENDGHRGQHRQQHADLGGDVGADAHARAVFAPEDRHLSDDLEQSVGEAEEEAGEGDPKDDLSRADIGPALRLECAWLNSTAIMAVTSAGEPSNTARVRRLRSSTSALRRVLAG